MAVSILDSRVFRDLFGTKAIRDVFSDEAYVQRMMQAEAALARAESSTGVIPDDSGAAITEALTKVTIDFELLSQETELVGYPVLPLVRQLVKQTPEQYARYIHWGATTQDIMDTAVMLQMKEGLAMVSEKLGELIAACRSLASKYRDIPLAGRTHMQHALPVTLGYKCAVYVSALVRCTERIEQLKSRCLLVQFGGAAGTLASLGEGVGIKVRNAMAKELELGDPDITWHAARDVVAEPLLVLAMIGGILGKIATDIIHMSSSEVGEVSEPYLPLRGASSTMPQKRNAISCEVVSAAAKMLRSCADNVLDSMVADHERATGPWHCEWKAVPEAFVLAVGALAQTAFVMAGLGVDKEAMKRNLASSRGLICAESVMMGLAKRLGRNPAHEVVYTACRKAVDEDKDLVEALMEMDEVVTGVGGSKDEVRQQLDKWVDPASYLGSAQIMVDEVLQRSQLHGFGK